MSDDKIKFTLPESFTEGWTPQDPIDELYSMSDEDRAKYTEHLQSIGVLAPTDDGVLTEAGQGLAQNIASVGASVGSSIGSSTMENYFKGVLNRNQQWNTPEDISTASYIGRTVGSALGSTLPTLAAGAVGSLIAPGVGTVAGLTAGFMQTFGDNVQRNRKAGYSEDKALGMAFLESAVDTTIENLPFGIIGKGAGNAFRAARATVKGHGKLLKAVGKQIANTEKNKLLSAISKKLTAQLGKKNAENLLWNWGKSAAMDGLGEAGEEALQYINSWANQKLGGDPNAEFSFDDFTDAITQGLIGGFFLQAARSTPSLAVESYRKRQRANAAADTAGTADNQLPPPPAGADTATVSEDVPEYTMPQASGNVAPVAPAGAVVSDAEAQIIADIDNMSDEAVRAAVGRMNMPDVNVADTPVEFLRKNLIDFEIARHRSEVEKNAAVSATAAGTVSTPVTAENSIARETLTPEAAPIVAPEVAETANIPASSAAPVTPVNTPAVNQTAAPVAETPANDIPEYTMPDAVQSAEVEYTPRSGEAISEPENILSYSEADENLNDDFDVDSYSETPSEVSATAPEAQLSKNQRAINEITQKVKEQFGRQVQIDQFDTKTIKDEDLKNTLIAAQRIFKALGMGKVVMVNVDNHGIFKGATIPGNEETGNRAIIDAELVKGNPADLFHTAMHELVHNLIGNNEKAYLKFKKAVMDKIYNKDYYNELFENYLINRGFDLVDFTEKQQATIEEEFICDTVADLMQTEKFWEILTAEDMSFAQKLLNALKDLLAKITSGKQNDIPIPQQVFVDNLNDVISLAQQFVIEAKSSKKDISSLIRAKNTTTAQTAATAATETSATSEIRKPETAIPEKGTVKENLEVAPTTTATAPSDKSEVSEKSDTTPVAEKTEPTTSDKIRKKPEKSDQSAVSKQDAEIYAKITDQSLSDTLRSFEFRNLSDGKHTIAGVEFKKDGYIYRLFKNSEDNRGRNASTDDILKAIDKKLNSNEFGNRWKKHGKDRLYLNDGVIGKFIKATNGSPDLWAYSIFKPFYDYQTGELWISNNPPSVWTEHMRKSVGEKFVKWMSDPEAFDKSRQTTQATTQVNTQEAAVSETEKATPEQNIEQMKPESADKEKSLTTSDKIRRKVKKTEPGTDSASTAKPENTGEESQETSMQPKENIPDEINESSSEAEIVSFLENHYDRIDDDTKKMVYGKLRDYLRQNALVLKPIQQKIKVKSKDLLDALLAFTDRKNKDRKAMTVVQVTDKNIAVTDGKILIVGKNQSGIAAGAYRIEGRNIRVRENVLEKYPDIKMVTENNWGKEIPADYLLSDGRIDGTVTIAKKLLDPSDYSRGDGYIPVQISIADRSAVFDAEKIQKVINFFRNQNIQNINIALNLIEPGTDSLSKALAAAKIEKPHTTVLKINGGGFFAYIMHLNKKGHISEITIGDGQARSIVQKSEPNSVQTTSDKIRKKPEKSEMSDKDEKIEDYGEKIGGAKKDIIRRYADKINLNGTTFAKMFPKPDYAKLLEAGIKIDVLAKLKTAYDMAKVGVKKHKKMDGRQDLTVAKFYASFAKNALTGEDSVDFTDGKWVFTDFGKRTVIVRSQAMEQILKELGVEYADVDLSRFDISDTWENGKKPEVPKWASKNQDEEWQKRYRVWTVHGSKTGFFDDLQDAIKYFVEVVKKHTTLDQPKYKIITYKAMSGEHAGEYYLAAKIRGFGEVTLQYFKSLKEAWKYSDEHSEELQHQAAEIEEQKKAERKSKFTGKNQPLRLRFNSETLRDRVGIDYRNGKDVSAKEFAERFNFRAVEFGNSVSQKERQTALNALYDSLMDMANALDISPEAISLNGKLAFAYGARGSGNAEAHYEPEKNVINLTRTRGAGNVAHEWWHALDYYFADSKTTPATDGKFRSGIRDEVKNIFQKLNILFTGNSPYVTRAERLDAFTKKNYYTQPTEMAARAFGDYITRTLKNRGQVNDFLSSSVSEKDWKGEEDTYPYPTGEDAVKIDDTLQSLFNTIDEKTDESGNRILFSMIGDRGAAMIDRTAGTNYLDNLRVARDMAEHGKDAKTIKLATGWEKGGDGKWRMEIPDVKFIGAEVLSRDLNNITGFLEYIVDAPELFAAYPKLKNMLVRTVMEHEDTLPDSVAGRYDGEKILINAKATALTKFEKETLRIAREEIEASWNLSKKEIAMRKELGMELDPEKIRKNSYAKIEQLENLQLLKFRDILIHEVQHAIQDQEGFAKGGSISIDKNLSPEFVHKAIAGSLRKHLSDAGFDVSMEEAMILADENADNTASEKLWDKLVDKGMTEEKYDKIFSKVPLFIGYNNLAGEVESRNAVARSRMSMNERHKSLLDETADVAEEDRIYLIDNAGKDDLAVGDKFSQIKNALPQEEGKVPLFTEKYNSVTSILPKLAEIFNKFPNDIVAADGATILIKNPDEKTGRIIERFQHLIKKESDDSGERDLYDIKSKIPWLPRTVETIENAQVKLRDPRSGNYAYVRAYKDGIIHVVIVTKSGIVQDQEIFDHGLKTQFVDRFASKRDYFDVVWERNTNKQKTSPPVVSHMESSGKFPRPFRQDKYTSDSQEVNPASEKNPEKNSGELKLSAPGDRASAQDKEYSDAVKRGDRETAIKMLKEKAEKSGVNLLSLKDNPAYKLLTGTPPKVTRKVYKCFTVDENGDPNTWFVGNNVPIPRGVWLKAKNPAVIIRDPYNGLLYVPTGMAADKETGRKATKRTGKTVPIDGDTRNRLIEAGILPKGSNAKTVTAVALRPGFHAGTLPYSPQTGVKREGSNYENVHSRDHVVFECEIGMDNDYTRTEAIKSGKNKGKLRYLDQQTMPENGGYTFATNPILKGQDAEAAWQISDTLKVGRPVPQAEADAILAEHGLPPQEWEQGVLVFSDLNLDPDKTNSFDKIIDITYDDNGELIPLSERFNQEKDDIRFSLPGDRGDTSLDPVDYRRSIDPLFDFFMEYSDNGILNPGSAHIGEDFSGAFISPEFVAYSVKRKQGKNEADATYRKYLERRQSALENASGASLDTMAKEYVEKFGGDKAEVAEKLLDMLRHLTKKDLISERAEAKREVKEAADKQRKEDEAEWQKQKAETLRKKVDELFKAAKPVVDKRWIQINRQLYTALFKTVFPDADTIPDIPSDREMRILNMVLENGNMSEAALIAEPYYTDKDKVLKDKLDKAQTETLTEFILRSRGGKGFMGLLHDINGKPDINLLEYALMTPMWIAKKFAGTVVESIYKAARMMVDDKNRIMRYLSGDAFEKLMQLRQKDKAMYDKLNAYILKCDRDQTGAGKVKGNKEQTEFTATTADGEVIGKFDNEETAWDALFKREQESLVDNGYSELAAESLYAIRSAMRRSFLFRLHSTIQYLRQAGLIDAKSTSFIIRDPEQFFPGEDIPANQEIDLFELMREMGQRSGYYMPRIRHGKYMLRATKAGHPVILKGFDSKLARVLAIGKYRKEGYKTENFLANTPDQDMLGQLNPAALSDILNQAMERAKDVFSKDIKIDETSYITKDGKTVPQLAVSSKMKLSYSVTNTLKKLGGRYYDGAWRFDNFTPETKTKLKEIIESEVTNEVKTAMVMQSVIGSSIVDMIRENSSGSSKIARRTAVGDEVVQGYEEDVLRAYGLYISGVSGASARNVMAKKMYAAFGGMDFDRQEYINSLIPENLEKGTPEYQEALTNATAEYFKEVHRRALNSAKSPRIAKYMDKYIKDMLRNSTSLDRVLGAAKGISAVWMLNKPASAINNLFGAIGLVPSVIHGETNCGMRFALRNMLSGLNKYIKYAAYNKWGMTKGLTGVDSRIFDIIHKNRWDGAEMVADATKAGLTFAGSKYQAFSNFMLGMFSMVESGNRASSIYAAAMALAKKRGVNLNAMNDVQLQDFLLDAVKISDFGNGVYDKTNKLTWARGGDWQSVIDSALLFKTYEVNYYNNMWNMFNHKNLKGLLWTTISIIAMGGGKASIPVTAFLWALAALGITDPDDEEESDEYVYNNLIADLFGQKTATVAKYGIPSLLGINLSGTYRDTITDALHDGVPDGTISISDLPAYSIFKRLENAYEYGFTQPGKMVEEIIPALPASMSRSIREYNTGVTDRAGRQRKDVNNEYIKPGLGASIWRFFGFNPVSISEKTDRIWTEKKVKEKYAEQRREIYSRYRDYMKSGDTSDSKLAQLALDIEEYNAKVNRSRRNIPLIDEAGLNRAAKDTESKFLKSSLDEKAQQQREKKEKGKIVIRNGKLVREEE